MKGFLSSVSEDVVREIMFFFWAQIQVSVTREINALVLVDKDGLCQHFV